MEKKLAKLFDYQRFERNEHLDRLIAETENRCSKELSDDNLEFVSAAGEERTVLGMTVDDQEKQEN